jgi:phosphate/sulfate permease
MSYMYDATSLGQFGNEVLAAGQNASGEFAAIQTLATTTFTTITEPAGDMGQLVGTALLAGTVLYGRFTSVTVGTGLAVVYKNGIK